MPTKKILCILSALVLACGSDASLQAQVKKGAKTKSTKQSTSAAQPTAKPQTKAGAKPDAKAEAKTDVKNSALPLGTSPDFGKLPTYIKSDSLQLKQTERYFVYSGNVEMKHGDMTITSNTLEGTYDEQNKLKKLIAKTNVQIVKGDNIHGSSELATYEAAQDTVTLTENPELSQNGSVLTADAIKIFLKDNRSEASGQVRVKMIDKNASGDLLGKMKS